MKTYMTRREVVNGSRNLVSVPYCSLQTLLKNHNPVGYSSGTYGWNYDVYEIDGLTICTGYRSMPGRTAKNFREYENRAKAVMVEHDRSFEDRLAEIESLLHEFIEQA